MNSLRLDYCENQHGFWLDAGEEERVLQLMKDREKDMKRKFEAEAEWDRTLQRFRSKSFWRKLTDLFR
jgi:Zn-finger nucleic acid-binding protein